MGSTKDLANNEVVNIENIEQKYIPIIEATEVSKIDRETTLQVLKEVLSIIKERDETDNKIKLLKNRIDEEVQKVKSIRNQLSDEAYAKIFGVVVISFILGWIIFNFILAIICCAVAGYIGYTNIGGKDLALHQKENNAKADEYQLNNVEPLKRQLANELLLKSEFEGSGKVEWVSDILGDDRLEYAVVEELYFLVKSRRADSIKEALNKLDDELHKARMEEMQQAIKDSAEISAMASIKQTQQLEQIEKEMAETARSVKKSEAYNKAAAKSAKMSEAYNKAIYHNTRR